jgi:phthalate 4,5-dioxygenase oxygenase subunit
VSDEEKQHEGGIGPDYIKVRNIHNDYLQDRGEQKRETFTGMGRQFLIHDSCATESMGPIYDRSKEHLGAGDITAIAVRKFLLNSMRAIDMGKEPPHIIRTSEQNDLGHVACIVAKIDATTDPKTYIHNLIAEMKQKTNHG